MLRFRRDRFGIKTIMGDFFAELRAPEARVISRGK